jgi:hypothetical protein
MDELWSQTVFDRDGGFDVIARELILSREPGGHRFAFARPP